MKLQTRLLQNLEPGWTLETPGRGEVEDPLTGNLRPAPSAIHEVSAIVQQRLLASQSESGSLAVVDERVAIVLPIVDIPPDAVLYSPRGERWNAAGEGVVRRTLRRRPVYSVVSVRRAREGDRNVSG